MIAGLMGRSRVHSPSVVHCTLAAGLCSPEPGGSACLLLERLPNAVHPPGSTDGPAASDQGTAQQQVLPLRERPDLARVDVHKARPGSCAEGSARPRVDECDAIGNGYYTRAESMITDCCLRCYWKWLLHLEGVHERGAADRSGRSGTVRTQRRRRARPAWPRGPRGVSTGAGAGAVESAWSETQVWDSR